MYLIEGIGNGEYIGDGGVGLGLEVYVNENVFLDEDILVGY
ncbi:hypothetical protein [Staphylococcus auricularis]|nr:hypothetical protein [Staphylococcus auricularis]